MSEDSTAGAGTAPDGGTPAQNSPQQAGQGTGDGGTGPAPGLDDGGDLSPENMLAGALSDDNGGDGGGDDPAKELARLQKQIASLKKHSRTWEGRAKENSAAAAKLAELEDAQKTELQRATEGKTTAEQEATKWQSLYHRTLACAQYDIPLTLIDQIHGTTEDEISASAEGLAAAINERAAAMAAAQVKANGTQQYQQQGGQYRPVESLRPGALPASDNQPLNPETWLRRQIDRR